MNIISIKQPLVQSVTLFASTADCFFKKKYCFFWAYFCTFWILFSVFNIQMYFHWHFRECWLCWLCPQVTDKCSRYEYLKYFSNIVTANKTPIKIRIIPILIIIVISEISNISNLNNNNINNSIVKIKVKSNTKNYLKINWTEHHFSKDNMKMAHGGRLSVYVFENWFESVLWLKWRENEKGTNSRRWVIFIIFAFHKKTVSRVCLNIAKPGSFMNNVLGSCWTLCSFLTSWKYVIWHICYWVGEAIIMILSVISIGCKTKLLYTEHSQFLSAVQPWDYCEYEFYDLYWSTPMRWSK